jgi:hypothetical protein
MLHLQPDSLLQNRYRIVGLIAQGGMGAVYQAVDTRLGNTVALKQTLLADPQMRSAFEGEARLLAALHHPALAVVSDHFVEDGGQFLVMQFIPGDDLARLLSQQGSFPPAQVIGWANDLLDALEYLHTRTPPVIHRDIKPQNIKLGPRGNPMLLDFGLAKGVLAPVTTGVGQSIFGYTPQYAPMEQIQGAGTDARSDLYSLAATLYQLLTGQPPPDAITRAAAMVAGQPDPLLPADRLNPAVPHALAALLAQAMAQNPADRPQSAAAMRASLGAALGTQPLPPPPPTPVNSAGAPTVIVGGAETVAVRTGGQGHRGTGGQGDSGRLGRIFFYSGLGLVGLLMIFALQLVFPFISAPLDPSTLGPLATAPPDGAERGRTRANPLPAGATVVVPGWKAQVVEVLRGRAAWNALYAANSQNDPEPEGYEYYLVKLRVEATFRGEGRRLYPKITGADRVERLPVSAVTPEPRFPSNNAEPGQSFEGWIPYLIPTGEQDLLLFIEQLTGPEDTYPLYVALDEGAQIADDPALAEIVPTKLGTDPREPAAIGELVVSEDWELSLLEVVRGEAAMAMLLEANQFNDPPSEGMEYALVRVRARYIGITGTDAAVMIDSLDFKALPAGSSDPEADLIKSPAAVEPEPPIDAYLFPGGEREGWATIELPKGQPGALLIFNPGFNEINLRYFALE